MVSVNLNKVIEEIKKKSVVVKKVEFHIPEVRVVNLDDVVEILCQEALKDEENRI